MRMVELERDRVRERVQVKASKVVQIISSNSCYIKSEEIDKLRAEFAA